MASDAEKPGNLLETELHDLAVKSQSGDRVSYSRFLEKLIPPANRFLAGKAPESDRDDIVQNVLIAVHRALHTYRQERPFLPWFFAIARYRLIDYYRKEGRIKKTIEAVTDSWSDRTEDEVEPVSHSLEELICRLPAKMERVIRLMKLENLSVKEVAEITGMTESAVKVNAHRGYKKLKELYGKHEH